MSIKDPNFSINKSIRKALIKAVSYSGIGSLFGFSISLVLAYKYGANEIKDAIDLAVFVPFTIVALSGLNSFGISALYYKTKDVHSKNTLMFFTAAIGCQLLATIALFFIVNYFENQIISYYCSGLSHKALEYFKLFFRYSKYLIFLEPMRILVSNISTVYGDLSAIPFSMSVSKAIIFIGATLIGVMGFVVLPISYLIGYSLVVLILFIKLFQTGFHFLKIDKSVVTGIKESIKLVIPFVLSSFILQTGRTIFIPFIVALGAGMYASYSYAVVLYTLVISILVKPILDAVTPTLNRMEAENIGKHLAIVVYCGSLISIAILLLSRSGVAIAFYRGNMDYDQVGLVADLVMIFGCSAVFNVLNLYMNRKILSDRKYVSFLGICFSESVLKVAIIFFFSTFISIYAAAIATVISSICVTILSLYLYGREIKIPNLKSQILWYLGILILGVLIFLLPIPIYAQLGINLLVFFICLLATLLLIYTSYKFQIGFPKGLISTNNTIES
jgi:peptidoglycan biosynthesis protein MviN/MurJ (putative lipid II flippase)